MDEAREGRRPTCTDADVRGGVGVLQARGGHYPQHVRLFVRPRHAARYTRVRTGVEFAHALDSQLRLFVLGGERCVEIIVYMV